MTDEGDIKYIDVEGIRTRYFEKGKGEPLVLIHGGAMGTGSSLGIFGENLDALARSFHVFAFDKIGHGYTDNPETDDDYTIERMTAHAYQLIRAVGLDRTNLIGQSRGAFNGVSLCLDYPELVHGFVLCNSASMTPGVAAIPPFSKKARAEAPFEAGTKEWVRYRSEIMCYSKACVSDDYVDEWHKVYHLPKSTVAREKMKTLGPGLFEPGFDAVKERELARIREGALRVPTLVHWGKNDPSAALDPMGYSVFNLLSENAAEVSMYVANQAGHFAFKEKHADFNRVVTGFFESLD